MVDDAILIGAAAGGQAMHVEVVFDRGIFLPGLSLWLDALRQQDTSVVSHAHSDHVARHRHPVLTHRTRLLLGDYYDRSEPVELEYGEPLETPEYTVTLHPAGHCLGSAQTLVTVRSSGERLLYTGDLRTRPSPINEPAESVVCDTLIIESTYGHPAYTFPPQDEAIATAVRVISQWLDQGTLPIVLGWRLGKAQETLYYLLSAGFAVACDESVYDIARRYEEAGVCFPGDYRVFNGSVADGEVLLFPPGKKAREQMNGQGLSGRAARHLELTGWAAGKGAKPWGSGRPGDASLPYSDHADFNDLIAYVQAVQPRQVYTVFGFPDLAQRLRQMGYAAVHLGKNATPADQALQMPLL
ncbi:MAG: MBL fold metallo-hydrolase [Chloroflexi bacterium]|nr:MBL fold metallo-hydrolase [Chloroflexota bacterium]MYD48426.1 MBL fold metallo-hydrolase [Chloroflexota bacterium]